MDYEVVFAYIIFLTTISSFVGVIYCICNSNCCEKKKNMSTREDAKMDEAEQRRFEKTSFFQKIPISTNFFFYLSEECACFHTEQQFFKKISYVDHETFLPFLSSLNAVSAIAREMAQTFVSSGTPPEERLLPLSLLNSAFHVVPKFGSRNGKSSNGKFINVVFGKVFATQAGKWSISYGNAVNLKCGEIQTLANQVSL